MSTEVRQHGVKGVYRGGDWVPIEECTKHVESLQSSDKCDHKSWNASMPGKGYMTRYRFCPETSIELRDVREHKLICG